MWRTLLLLVFSITAVGCTGPDLWCEESASQLTTQKKTALASYERAAIEWRAALASGEPESADQRYIENLALNAARFIDAEGKADARFLIGWTRNFISRSAKHVPDPRIRLRAAASTRRWAPQARPYLP